MALERDYINADNWYWVRVEYENVMGAIVDIKWKVDEIENDIEDFVDDTKKDIYGNLSGWDGQILNVLEKFSDAVSKERDKAIKQLKKIYDEAEDDYIDLEDMEF